MATPRAPGPVLAEGREAVIHEWGEGLVLRLMRSRAAGPDLTRSTAASEAARAAGVATPAVVEIVEVSGRPGQVLERVDGPDLFAHMAANPLRLRRAAGTLAEVHLDLHHVTAPPELESTREHLASRIDTSGHVPRVVKATALRTLSALADGDAICHGDFHPGNLLLTASGPMLIDWTNATRGDAAADFARTRLMLRAGALPPGAPTTIRALAAIGRRHLWRLYDRRYRRARPVEPSLLDAWTLVGAANRLADGIEAERATLLEILRRHGVAL